MRSHHIPKAGISLYGTQKQARKSMKIWSSVILLLPLFFKHFFLNLQDTTSSNPFVIINDMKKIFLTCNKIRALLQKIGSRAMLPSINSNVLAFKIIRKLSITEKPLNLHRFPCLFLRSVKGYPSFWNVMTAHPLFM
jgi:hypothetical protein